MIKLIRDLFHMTRQQRLPRLNHSLTEEFDPQELDRDMQLVLMIGRSRDPVAAQRLLEQYEAENASELLPRLPVNRADWRLRLANWIRFIEGSYASNPHADELRQRHSPDQRL